MKIRHVCHNDIDKSKWDNAILASPQCRVYATSWYLDAATNRQWNALVSENYEHVMPLPVKRLWPGTSIIYQPVLSQQLGIFGRNIGSSDIQDFLQAIPNKFAEVSIPMNSANRIFEIDGYQVVEKTNLELDVSISYKELYSAFQKGVRSALKKGQHSLILSESDDVDTLVSFYKEVMQSKLNLKNSRFTLIRSIIMALMSRNYGFIVEARDLQGNLVGANFFCVFEGRIINLFGASNLAGRKLEAMHNLLNFTFLKYAGKPFIFDFEGSDIPPVKAFFESFGAKHQPYAVYTRTKISPLLSTIRSLKASFRFNSKSN